MPITTCSHNSNENDKISQGLRDALGNIQFQRVFCFFTSSNTQGGTANIPACTACSREAPAANICAIRSAFLRDPYLGLDRVLFSVLIK